MINKKDLGFWHSLRKLSGDDIFSWVTLSAGIFGIGGAVLVLAHTQEEARTVIAADFLFVLGPLLGVVVAAFALVIALFSDNYLRELMAEDEGVIGFLRPFLVGIGIQVGSILWTVAYRASASWMPSKVEVFGWIALCFLFSFSLLDVVALAKNVLAHGVTRAQYLRIKDIEESNNVVQHPKSGSSSP